MLYTKKALQMGAIAVGLAAFAGQSSLAESVNKEDAKPVARTETMQVMPELTMASHFVGVPYNRSGVSVSVINPEEFQKAGIETLTGALSQTPGVFTLDGGGTWQRGSVSNTVIRGMNKDTYTLTMVDGMRISDVNMSGNKLLGITNLFTVGNVEVVKGAQGAVFGSGAIGASSRWILRRGRRSRNPDFCGGRFLRLFQQLHHFLRQDQEAFLFCRRWV
ncbi:MAG: TonB-dependent receptor [Akkermansia sp.]